MKKSIILLILSILLIGCENEYTNVAGHYYEPDEIDLSKNSKERFGSPKIKTESRIKFKDLQTSQTKCSLTPASYINLQGDGEYTLFAHKYEYGTYRVNSDTINFKNSKGNSWQMKREEVKNSSKVRFNYPCEFGGLQRMTTNFSDNDKAENPFLQKYNLWRVPAQNSETTEEIVERLQNHISFLERYLSWSASTKKKLQFIDISSPFKLGRNFIGIKKNGVDSEWEKLFFKGESEKALGILEFLILTDPINLDKYSKDLSHTVKGLSEIKEKLNSYKDFYTSFE